MLYPVVYNPAEGNLCFQTQSRPFLRRLHDGSEAQIDGATDAELNGVPIASGLSPVQEQQGLALAELLKQLKDLGRTVEHLSARVSSLEATLAAPAKADPAGVKRASKEG